MGIAAPLGAVGAASLGLCGPRHRQLCDGELAPGACDDLNALTTRQMVGDAYVGLGFFTQDPRIDHQRVALLGFVNGVATAAVLADTVEARDTFAS